MRLASLDKSSSVAILSRSKKRTSGNLLLITVLLFFSVASSVRAEDGTNEVSSGARWSKTPVVGISPIGSYYPLAFVLFQVDADSPQQSDRPAENSQENCLRAQARARYFTSLSWFAAFLLAIALYALAMLIAPKGIPPPLKWLMAPVIAALLVSALVANFVQTQLTHSCSESNSFRTDTFITTAMWDGAIVLILFSLWSVLLYYRRHKRLKVAAE